MTPLSTFTSFALSFLLVSSASALPQTASPPSTAPQAEVIYRFPDGTWIENLAVRSNGGGILVDDLRDPQVYFIDPAAANPTPQVVAKFPGPATGVFGIFELSTDVFYVATGAFNLTTLSPDGQGTGQIWRLDMAKFDACEQQEIEPELIADLPQSVALNGVTGLPDGKTLLIAESGAGFVFRLNVETKAVDIPINNPLTSVNSSAMPPLGVNGIHASEGYLYLTNTGKAQYSRVPIDSTGLPTGDGEVLAQGNIFPDDFAVTSSGAAAFIADGAANVIQFTSGAPGSAFKPVCSVNGPTAVQFGRTDSDKNTLYVTASGNDTAYSQSPVPVGGAILRFDLSSAGVAY